MRSTHFNITIKCLILTGVILLAAIIAGYNADETTLRKNGMYLADSSGPTLTPMMPEFIDLVPGNGPVNVSLELRVNATDSDGVEVVIGSYSNRSESTWTNVTMILDPLYEDPNVYLGIVNYTLDDEHRGVYWNIRFFASDTLGNWNVSEDTFQSVTRGNVPTTTTAQPPELELFELVLVLPVVVVIIIAMVWIRRR